MNILLVGDIEDDLQNLTSKLVFLRKNDCINKSGYNNVQNDITIKKPDVILICENQVQGETVNLIKIVKETTDCPVVLITTSNDKDFVLECCDLGIDDFVTADIPDYELVVRIIHNVKFNSLKNKNEQYSLILKQMKVINEVQNVYNYDFAKQAIENYIDNNLIKTGSFMALSPANRCKAYYSSENFITAIKASVRTNDIVTLGKGISYYIFMPETDMNGAIFVLNKIKDKLDFEISAGISGFCNNNFNKFEQSAQKALAESLALEKDFTFAQEEKIETLDSWLTDKSSNDFKIFRQIFNKKLEKVITPVFYRLQKAYEEKLFNTKIEQYFDENQCVFNLKNKKGNSSLKIIYPGFAKIIILIEHEGLDSPENKEIKLPLTKITEEELIDIIENFVKEYKDNVIG